MTTPVRYWTGQDHGHGVAANISNNGMFLRIDRVLAPGKRIQLILDWPSSLKTEQLEIKVSGNVLRSSAAGTAVQVRRYEIRQKTKR